MLLRAKVILYPLFKVTEIMSPFNTFSEASRPTEAIFHVEHLRFGRIKVCSDNLDQMQKMASMPIYGKIL